MHGKRRTIQNLEKNDDGEWVCSTGSECKTETAPKKSENENEETAKCVLHGKTRTLSNLGKDHNGDWVCLGSSLCKDGNKGWNRPINSWSGSYGNFQMPQHGGWMPMAYGGGPFCSVHRKKRTMQNLTRNNTGEWVCLPGSRCKMVAGDQLRDGTEIKICTVHGKQRSSTNMELNEENEWVCIEKYRCKEPQKGSKSGEGQMCTVHNKSRTAQNLKQDDNGDWVCITGSRCK